MNNSLPIHSTNPISAIFASSINSALSFAIRSLIGFNFVIRMILQILEANKFKEALHQ